MSPMSILLIVAAICFAILGSTLVTALLLGAAALALFAATPGGRP